METTRLDRSCGKNQITLDKKNGEEHRKPKPMALNEEDSKKTQSVNLSETVVAVYLHYFIS